MGDNLFIQLKGLPDGNSRFHWDLGKEFFASFGNSDILEASVEVDVKLEKSGESISLYVTLGGKVTVPCDRCLAPLDVEIGTGFDVDARPGSDCRNEEENGIDISQDVYDYTCLSIPMHRVHADGLCDQDVVRYIGADKATVSGASPFESLGALLGKNK